MCSTKIFLAMIFNEIKCHINTSSGLVGGMHPLHVPAPASVATLLLRKSTRFHDKKTLTDSQKKH